MNTSDTIIAPATAPGDGGIAIIRISGPKAYAALLKFFRPTGQVNEFETHRLYHGSLVDSDSQQVDEVMAVYMAAPRTYTRDDVVEIHSHGSQQVVAAILRLYNHYGLRLAAPGEFTYRAYINGRLDLSQAEAVSRLVSAKSISSYKLALSQVDGLLSRKIHSFADQLKHALVLSEAWIDFPEENIPAEDVEQIASITRNVLDALWPLLDSYNSGKVLSEGARIILVGQPNVGKSSLLNALLGEDRAIVTAVPGTTRDLLEEGLTIGGVPVRLIDTAGLHKAVDPVEIEGIRRAEQHLEVADLVLLLIDGTSEADELDNYIHNRCRDLPLFVVLTKCDLFDETRQSPFPEHPTYSVSSKTDFGLDRLRQAIAEFLLGDYSLSSETVLLTERRHYEALQRCSECLTRINALLGDDVSLELLAFELREALYALGQISGETTTEAVLDDIFSGFCIGK